MNEPDEIFKTENTPNNNSSKNLKSYHSVRSSKVEEIIDTVNRIKEQDESLERELNNN